MMRIRRFFMEDWLADYKDSCRYNLGESGMPDMTVSDLLACCNKSWDELGRLMLKDHDTRGTEGLRQAIHDTYDGDVPIENITVTTGTSEALFILFNLFLEGRRAAVVPFPSFQALYEVPGALGAELRKYTLSEKNGFIPDPDEIASLLDDDVGVVVLNTPHNPSGVLVPEAIVERIVEMAATYGAAVISDEHYRFLPMDGLSPIRTLARPDGSVVATGSITKCFGMIGLRMGWIAASPALIADIRDFRDYLTHTLSPISDYLAKTVLENTGRFVDPAIARLRRNRTSLAKTINRISGLSLVWPEAGVVAFPRYEYNMSTDAFSRELIDRGVFVLPGSSFETNHHFRINLGMEPDDFNAALGIITEFCAGLTVDSHY